MGHPGRIGFVKPSFEIGPVRVGEGRLFLIAGPCVIESEAHVRKMAEAIDLTVLTTSPAPSSRAPTKK